MKDFSVLMGGKAGYGIDRSASILGRLLNSCGYRIYIYRDYPSLIRGGHTFSIIRAATVRIAAHRDRVDFLLALNQDTLDLHRTRLSPGALVILDSEAVRDPGLPDGVRAMPLPIGKIVKEEGAQEVMRNACMIGAFANAVGIPIATLEKTLAESFPQDADLNVRIAGRGFEAAGTVSKLAPAAADRLPLLSGSQAVGLGLIKGGLRNYVAYPMTPTTPLLHFLAEEAQNFGLKVIHPESELGVILMAIGFAYAGQKVAVGTSGGGFCLMTEGLSLSGMSEVPVVIVLGQRPGPSTGMPTYSGQADLHFALHAGQGEFVRLVVAPGDLEESYLWSGRALNLAWKYQIPAIVLTDKNLNEGVGNFDLASAGELDDEPPVAWNGGEQGYRRYEDSPTGVSPLAFAPLAGAVVKANSYEHEEYGISTEDPAVTAKMQDKRLRKLKPLAEELKGFRTIGVYGDEEASTALLCWGSNKGVCVESAAALGLKVVQPIVLSPFPDDALRKALAGVDRLIAVENNATGQLARLVAAYGVRVDRMILKYDGRPFALDELEMRLKEALT